MKYIYNCHTHIFNTESAPEGFLGGFVPKLLARILWPVLHTPYARRGVEWIIRHSGNTAFAKYASFVRVGTKKSQGHVFRDMKSNYNVNDRFVVLTLNMDHMGAGKAEENYAHQVYEMKRIKRNNPDTFLPFYSIDPRAGTADQLLKQAKLHIEKRGFVGIKIYPALGFYPFDTRLEKVYEWAEKNDIPIMTHCTRVGVFYLGEITDEMINPYPVWKPKKSWKYSKVSFPIKLETKEKILVRIMNGIKKFLSIKTRKKIKNSHFCDNFSHPHNYTRVLERFKKLKICFAHAGDDSEIIKGRSKKTENESWFKQILYLIDKYPNVYTDISFTLSNKKVFKDLSDAMDNPKVKEKVLFGTDYFMTLMKKSEKKLLNEFREHLYLNNKANLWKQITVDNPKMYLKSTKYDPK